MSSFINKIIKLVKSDDTMSGVELPELPTDREGYNGNIILNFIIPDEILLQIFQNVNDLALVKVVPQVCKHWRELSRGWHLWKTRLRKLGIKVSEQRLERFSSTWDDPAVIVAIQWLCVFNYRKSINHNLIKNPSGEKQFIHWRVSNGGDGLIVEETPRGCDPIPKEANLPTQHCFTSSYGMCTRIQFIELRRDYRLKPFVLDILRPFLLVSEWVTARFDCGAVSTIQTSVTGSELYKPVYIIIKWKDNDYGRVEWHKMAKKVPYEQLPEGMYKIEFKNLSCDTQFWAGHYGAKTTGSSVVLDISTD